jgi:hypothetical protein
MGAHNAANNVESVGNKPTEYVSQMLIELQMFFIKKLNPASKL